MALWNWPNFDTRYRCSTPGRMRPCSWPWERSRTSFRWWASFEASLEAVKTGFGRSSPIGSRLHGRRRRRRKMMRRRRGGGRRGCGGGGGYTVVRGYCKKYTVEYASPRLVCVENKGCVDSCFVFCLNLHIICNKRPQIKSITQLLNHELVILFESLYTCLLYTFCTYS